MAFNDAELVRLRLLIKQYDKRVTGMIQQTEGDFARSGPQVVHENAALVEKLMYFRRKFEQTERAVSNAMHTRARHQVGAFGPSQARARLDHLNKAKADVERVVQRIAALVMTGPMPIEFRHKGIVDIANKIEKQFTEIGEAHNPFVTDGPSVSAMAVQGGGWTLIIHVMILMLELTRLGVEAGSFIRKK